MRKGERIFTISKSKILKWGYEITARNYHNIFPTVDMAISYLKDYYGLGVKYRIGNIE